MSRQAWPQLRFRTVRLVALLAGMFVAATAFTVLTAASRTAQLHIVGTVTAHFVPAYDILVRPRGARTALEAQTGTVLRLRHSATARRGCPDRLPGH
jgi:putative ABC transport system permease protein